MPRAPFVSAGISQQLARRRTALLADLRYELALRIAANARMLSARQRLHFVLKAPLRGQTLELDWRPQLARHEIARSLKALTVNDCARDAGWFRTGHLCIDGDRLYPGENRIEIRWRAPIEISGGAITLYQDPADGRRYVYSLFVPAEASTVFPCFDQPDLKARFVLSLTLPGEWAAIGNAPIVASRVRDRRRTIRFAATEPISTYAFAFAAGPFVARRSSIPGDDTHLWFRRSQHRRVARHAGEILRLNHIALRSCARYFAHRFPFAKYDVVLIPSFPYRGMEHAGATFLDEESALPLNPNALTPALERAQLIFHETAHQWMGDLVTMRWFDDLWLKEGFANFMAYKLAERVFPSVPVRLAFDDLTTAAYEADLTAGSVALHTTVTDLTAAKSVYNSTVYAKAPAVLREIEHLLGASTFQRGVRDLVSRHAYGTIDWRDLIIALERSSGRPLGRRMHALILRPGVPRVRCSSPIRASNARAARSMHRGTQVHNYALLTLDRAGIEAALRSLPQSRNALHRARLWQALWTAVHDIKLDPMRYVSLATSILGNERYERIVTRVMARSRTIIERMLPESEQTRVAGALEATAWKAARSGVDPDLRLTWLRCFIALARTEQGHDRLATLLDRAGRDGAMLAWSDRLAIAARLVAAGLESPSRMIVCLSDSRQRSKRAFLLHCLEAAVPDSPRKRAILRRWLTEPSFPEHWIVTALDFLNHPAHAAITAALLPSALDALPALTRTRKIFFVNRWLSAFIGGQRDQHALATVGRFLRRRSLDAALRLKVLEATGSLERSVQIRAHWR